jgi:hypothetical protein
VFCLSRSWNPTRTKNIFNSWLVTGNPLFGIPKIWDRFITNRLESFNITHVHFKLVLFPGNITKSKHASETNGIALKQVLKSWNSISQVT